MTSRNENTSAPGFNRRTLLTTTAAAGASLALSNLAWAQDAADSAEPVNVALIGVGTEGRVLMDNMVKMPGIRFKAVCDIWGYYRDYVCRLLKRYKHEVTGYEDYKEMLDKEGEKIDAVVIATPDFVHHEHAIGCLKAGKHVYCEKEMSNTIENAKAMVLAAKETGKLLQIGHQRRSNPRYMIGREYVWKHKAIGRMTHLFGQWNRWKSLQFDWPKGKELDAATLTKYGYESMEHFRNWRWYRKYSGGPIADLGSHQIDIFNWFLNASPKAVQATGGNDYYEGRDWYDNIMALLEWEFEWDGKKKPARGFYQVLNTTSHGGFYETFMGDEGSMNTSEIAKKCGIRREDTVKPADWEESLTEWAAKNDPKIVAQLEEAKKKAAEKKEESKEEIKIGHSLGAEGRFFPIPLEAKDEKPAHRWHLENFFAAVRDPKKVKLNCPAEVGYDTAVTVLKINEAVATGKKIEYKEDEFKV
ncbi:MAG: 1,5-anhydro-D-fructose reductase [Planctomycetes bacterium ADurb.Bin126]|nr:MAG: 1,5-anhydro-D-fructose reductase [Planctomycetes bacterium ADurb.Bin126]HOD81073.1 Gfo/Idh/MocA family oxidoreductase [Phycisphaerae bacterium]HQL73653.1 Gfo/Idh/MocA family oxidoreductase [Phycisphaerae bacterium]